MMDSDWGGSPTSASSCLSPALPAPVACRYVTEMLVHAGRERGAPGRPQEYRPSAPDGSEAVACTAADDVNEVVHGSCTTAADYVMKVVPEARTVPRETTGEQANEEESGEADDDEAAGPVPHS